MLLMLFWIVGLNWSLVVVIAVLWWLNSNFHGDWAFLMNCEWNMFLVDHWAIDWNMNWIRHWLLDVVGNLSDDLNWGWDWNLHWNVNSLLNMNWVRSDRVNKKCHKISN